MKKIKIFIGCFVLVLCAFSAALKIDAPYKNHFDSIFTLSNVEALASGEDKVECHGDGSIACPEFGTHLFFSRITP